jgi:hypothetical protein
MPREDWRDKMTTLTLEKPKVEASYLDIYGQNHFYNMREIGRRKISALIWNEHNNMIDSGVQNLTASGLPMTQGAFEKLEHIVKQFTILSSQGGISSHELSFYMLCDKDAAKEGNPVVNDVYIAHDQDVEPAFCKISGGGGITSLMDIGRNLKKRVAGWAHSHGAINPFFSGRDKITFDHFIEAHRLYRDTIFEHDGHSHTYELRYTYGMVVNQRKDEPFTALNVTFPQYAFDGNGNVFTAYETRRFEEIGLKLIKGNHYTPSEEDIYRIREELKSRVTIDGGKKLGEYVKPEAVVYEEPVVVQEEPAPGARDRILSVLKARKIIRPEPVIEMPITAEEKSLEERLSELQDSYQNLELVYNLALQQNADLTEKLAYEQTRPVFSKYSLNMQRYYDRLLASENEGENLLGSVAKVMSGKYHANLDEIAKGNYAEDTSQKRVWKWENRLKAIMEIYEKNKVSLSKVNKGYLESLKEILKSNRYLRRKHKEKLDKINELLNTS